MFKLFHHNILSKAALANASAKLFAVVFGSFNPCSKFPDAIQAL